MVTQYLALAAIAAAFLMNLVLTPAILRLSHRFHWYDAPDHRKIHAGMIPRLGGVGIFGAFAVTAVAASAVVRISTGGAEVGILDIRYLPLAAGLLMIHGMGLVDDFHDLRAPVKLAVQVAAAATVTVSGMVIRSFTLPFIGRIDLGPLAYPFTVLWIVGIANAVNLIDGMDGLAGGIVAFAALAMGVVALIQGKPEAALLAFAICGAVGGFLVFNLPPARIFMGDSGAYFLGFLLASLPLLGVPKTATVSVLIIPLTVLIVPVLDTAAAILRRLRQRRHPFSPDRDHYHHKLMDLGFSARRILAVTYGFSAYLCAVAITSEMLPSEANGYLILVVWSGALLGYYALHVLRTKRQATQGNNGNNGAG